MNKILSKLIEDIPKDCSIVRLRIEKDNNFGIAIIENSKGTPQEWVYDIIKGVWK